MRIISISTLRNYWIKVPNAEQSLKSWIQESERANWNNPNQLKAKYKNASILNSKRVVFSIKGNEYRLIVDIEYRLKIIFIVWVGTHKKHDKIDANKIAYVKANKN